jgi:ribosome-interacting GTPase 1
LDNLRDQIWRMTGLIRVYLRSNGSTDEEPLALPEGATVADVAESVHSDLGATFSGARIWGPSARFEGQKVGREHVVQDTDTVEIMR